MVYKSVPKAPQSMLGHSLQKCCRFFLMYNSVKSQSIKDVYRLGRYNSIPKHPRPILIQFIRAADVFSQRRDL